MAPVNVNFSISPASSAVENVDTDFMGLAPPLGGLILMSIFIFIITILLRLSILAGEKINASERELDISYGHELTRVEEGCKRITHIRLLPPKPDPLLKSIDLEDDAIYKCSFLSEKEPRSISRRELDRIGLKEETARILAMTFETQGKLMIDSFNAEFMDYENVDTEEIGSIVMPAERTERIHSNLFRSGLVYDSRYPEIRKWNICAEDSEEERQLHQNRMFDHRLEIWFGMSPTKVSAPYEDNQHQYQILKIWEREIAVIVSIGKDGQKEMIEPYISLKEGHQVEYALRDEKFRAVLKTTMVVDDLERGFLWYQLRLFRPDLDEWRQIDLIHIYRWPEKNIHNRPIHLAEIVLFIHRLRAKRRTRKWHPTPLQKFEEIKWIERDLGILVHCIDGQYRSPAMAAILIAYNRAMHQQKVAMMDIIRWVRRHRYQAWKGDDQLAFAQFQLIFAVSALLFEMATKKAAVSKRRVSTAKLIKTVLSLQEKETVKESTSPVSASTTSSTTTSTFKTASATKTAKKFVCLIKPTRPTKA